MTTLSADAIRAKRGTPQLERYTITTGATVYVGGSSMLVGTTGRVKAGASVTGTAASGLQAAGVIVKLEKTDGQIGTGVGDTSGTQTAIVDYGSEFLFTLHSSIQTNTSLRKNVYFGNSDDNLAAGTSCAATSGAWVPMGQLMAFDTGGKTKGWVRIARFGKTDVTT